MKQRPHEERLETAGASKLTLSEFEMGLDDGQRNFRTDCRVRWRKEERVILFLLGVDFANVAWFCAGKRFSKILKKESKKGVVFRAITERFDAATSRRRD